MINNKASSGHGGLQYIYNTDPKSNDSELKKFWGPFECAYLRFKSSFKKYIKSMKEVG